MHSASSSFSAVPQSNPLPAPPLADSPTRRRQILHYLALIIITAFAGFIRFAWIDRPTLWNDEGHTFRRLTGSFQDLLDILQNSGFAPLHYELHWYMGHLLGGAAKLTPFWMRFVPSLAGTLMVPAMYFLTRQISTRRTALLAAAFAACSAYLMAYSHDAKMYMHFWLFCTLNMACFLWWIRTNLRIAWLAWVAAGLAMAGLHGPGLLLLAIQPLFLVTINPKPARRTDPADAAPQESSDAAPAQAPPRKGWRMLRATTPILLRLIYFILGAAIILSGSAVYWLKFDRWGEGIDQQGWERASGLQWVTGVIRGRDGPNLMRFATGAFLYSWEWPASTYDPDRQTLSYRNTERAFSRMLQGYNIDPRVMMGLMTAILLILVLAAIGAFPWSPRLRGASPKDPPAQPAWRSAFWLLLWLVIPTYPFYCLTIFPYATPVDWLRPASSMPLLYWLFPIPALLLLECLATVAHRAMSRVARASSTPSGNWPLEPQSSTPLVSRGSLAIIRISQYLPRLLAIALIAAAVIIIYVAEKRIGLFALRAIPADWWRLPPRFVEELVNLLAQPYAVYAAALLLPALIWHYSAPTLGQRVLRLLHLIAVLAALFLLCLITELALRRWKPAETGPLWMPRYFAMVWPAFAIILCILIMRLPTRPLRWLAIAVLLGVNLAQTWGRMFGGSEPPVDRMIADLWASQPSNTTTRAYLQPGAQSPHPAGGSIYNNPGKYYLSIARGDAWLPNVYPNSEITQVVTVWTDTSPRRVASDLRRNPRLERIIVWDRFPEVPTSTTDSLLDQLGANWTRTSEQYFPVRYHWNWSTLYVSRRREYTRPASSQ